MTDVLEKTRPSAERRAAEGRPQRESVAIALKELGFYDRLPKIRKDSRAFLLSSRERLLAQRPAPKMTPEQALAQREELRARPGGKLLEASKFTLTSLSPQSIPTSQELQAQDTIQYGSVAVVGHGTGFDLDRILGYSFLAPWGFIASIDPQSGSDFNQFIATWSFSYVPPVDGFYNLSTGLIAWGNYTLISDDGPFDSHEVHANLIGGIGALNGSKQTQLFDRGDDNINEADSFANADTVEIMVEGTAGVQIDITTGFVATVSARGDDTFAQFDMTQAVGGLMCSGVSVAPY